MAPILTREITRYASAAAPETQQQIDVYGELLGAAYRLADQITATDSDMRAFLVALADAAKRWRETGQGIWEVRGESRHFLYSKSFPQSRCCWAGWDVL